jgi:hypothetical protein
MLSLAVSTAVLATAATAASAAGWLCVAEQATGFKFNAQTRSWQSAVFRTNAHYIIRPPNGEEAKRLAETYKKEIKWVVVKVGSDFATMCEGDVNEYGFLNCESIGGPVAFNKNTLRFQLYYGLGYVRTDEESAATTASDVDTPFIEIGKCAPL